MMPSVYECCEWFSEGRILSEYIILWILVYASYVDIKRKSVSNSISLSVFLLSILIACLKWETKATMGYEMPRFLSENLFSLSVPFFFPLLLLLLAIRSKVGMGDVKLSIGLAVAFHGILLKAMFVGFVLFLLILIVVEIRKKRVGRENVERPFPEKRDSEKTRNSFQHSPGFPLVPAMTLGLWLIYFTGM